ncbi:MAG: PD40 domain-containing protein [Pirellulales bacterium]|nr:PD40 domain-containing protein [Pirellulales bacterium]
MILRLVCSVGVLCVAAAARSGESAQYRLLSHRNDLWYGSTYWTGPDWTRVGKDWHHPGVDTPSVRCFETPRDGRVTISGRVFKADTNNGGGDGVRVSICHNLHTVWSAEMDGADTDGLKHGLTLEVRRGDAIRFVVHKRGDIYHDTTRWDPQITYADGARFQASQGFSADQQGFGGWSYAMQLGPGVAVLPGPDDAELDLPAMVELEWGWEDKLDGTPDSYAAAAARHLEKARRLLEDLRAGRPNDFLAGEAEELEQLATGAETGSDRKQQYLRARRLKRRIALANPLMDFGALLFCKRAPTSYSHLVMQYYGWRARAGGGIFILEEPGRSLACRDILEGRLADGNVLQPSLGYDGKRIVFSFVRCADRSYDPSSVGNGDQDDEGFYHIYAVDVDGGNLRRLTAGPYDDLMPAWLPDGGIVFCSTRRRGYARCFGPQFSRRWDVYTLHRMDADGGNVRALSLHDTNEWFPAVDNAGRVLYARWDYIDRDAVTHQNLWTTRPDGTNPATLWGNATPSPHCAFQARPIPGSNKIVFTASAHHSITAGSIALVAPAVGYDGHEALTRLTPEVPFPEAEGRDIRQYYSSPWPLSEKYFLVAYSPVPLVWEPGANARNALGLYLLDWLGNRELLYRDPAVGSTNPCPLVPRPVPPVLPSALPPDPEPVGEMVLADVYRGLGTVPRGSIKQLRIVQIFPKTTPWANVPKIGVAGEENARAILGTVPVEPDGSARFIVPAGKPFLLQALDEQGMAYQTMRSVTYVQPGERVACVGCHESRLTTPVDATPAALHRRPSAIDPGPLGGRPFSYVEVVQPVLDRHCLRCHGGHTTEADLDLSGAPEGEFTRSYVSLCRDKRLVPRFEMRNQIQVTPPGGSFGARGSRLMSLLVAGHEEVELSAGEFRRLAAWIDLNAVFYGDYSPTAQQRQLRGETLPMPEIQ